MAVYKYEMKFDSKKRAAAVLFSKLYRPIFLTLSKIFIALGVLAVTLQAVNLFVVVPLIYLVWPFAYFGFVSYVFYVFVAVYLPTFRGSFDPKAPLELISALDFGSTIAITKEDVVHPNLIEIFYRLRASKKVRFTLEKIGAMEGLEERILTTLPNTPNNPQLFSFIISEAIGVALENNQSQITAADLFYGYLKSCKAHEQILIELGLDEKDLKNVIFWADSVFKTIENPKTLTERLMAKTGGIAEGWSAGYTIHLDQYSFDIAQKIPAESFSVAGRDSIIAEVEEVLARDGKDNCLLVGPLGVGKRTIVQELAKRVYWGESPENISHYRILQLDVASIISTAENSKELEGILVGCFNDAVSAGNVILFIDNIETIFSGSKEGTIDASVVIQPYLESDRIRIIGTVTDDHYASYIEPKAALANGFSKIEVEALGEADTIRILENISLYFFGKYRLDTNYLTVKEVYKIAEKYPGSQEMPSRAVSLFEEVCGAAEARKMNVLTKELVDEIVQAKTSMPLGEVTSVEKEKLLNLEALLHERLIGQEKAVAAVANALKRARGNIQNNTRPIGSFLFFGPTGVGKTELAKSLAEIYFGAEEAMIRFDMSEYQGADAINRLIGKKRPGSEELEGGDLVKAVRQRPFSLILLDEVEKANPRVLDLFLQILEDGFVSDGLSQRVSFSNTIIIATSNAGSLLVQKGILEGKSEEALSKEVIRAIEEKGVFRIELVNRFDGVILFRPLTKAELVRVAELMFGKIKKDLAADGYKIVLTPGLLEKIAEEGYQPELGARPMRRVFQDRLENYLADQKLKGELVKGREFIVDESVIYSQTS